MGAAAEEGCLASRLSRTREDHATAFAARDSGAMFPPPAPQDDAAERRASVTSEPSAPPVPVDITTAHRPAAATMQWWDRLGFHSMDTIGSLFAGCSPPPVLAAAAPRLLPRLFDDVVQVPAPQQPAGLDLPEPHDPVLVAARQELSVGTRA